MWKLLLLAFALGAVGAVVAMGAKTRILPPCPIDQPFRGGVICSCPVGYHFRAECTEPHFEHWQCVIAKKELLYCTQ